MQAPGLAHARVRRQPVERGERVQEGAAALWSEREVYACVPESEVLDAGRRYHYFLLLLWYLYKWARYYFSGTRYK